MRGYLTRRFLFTDAVLGYYDMHTNKMVEACTISGKWKKTDQVLRYAKKNREALKLPKDKQITVLSMEVRGELRKMSHDDFYKYSQPVDEKEPQQKQKRSHTPKVTKNKKKK